MKINGLFLDCSNHYMVFKPNIEASQVPNISTNALLNSSSALMFVVTIINAIFDVKVMHLIEHYNTSAIFRTLVNYYKVYQFTSHQPRR